MGLRVYLPQLRSKNNNTITTMKQTWEKLNTDSLKVQEILEALGEMLPQSPKFLQVQKKLDKAWRSFTVSFNLMDEFVQPTIKSVQIDSRLFANAEFKITWKFWKEYLVEQHAIHMRSRAELMALKRLHKMADEKPERAIYIVEHAMSTLSKSFYLPNEPIPETANGKTKTSAYSLPAQYSTPPTKGANGKKTKFHQTTLHEQIERETSSKIK